ncbi:MAG: CpsD/CapB family tyrosine-protein kinase [Oscillospiraceae bacterium]|nr:CpsD/CapB family tyrosine-protein kinase [Oscillospiraceae bacterium]MBQ7000303.1 CpsD/CapB family tyrosine-protein kinase [Oscillospiraceae bacterium]
MSNQEVQKTEQAQTALTQRRMILNESSPFALQEAYKTLRTNIQFSLRGNACKRFCITSCSAGEGKSITILNLAISFAQTGKRVLLIDADLRRPALARLMVEKAAPGLSNVLAEQVELAEAIRTQIHPNLDVMFAGDVPPNPSELLSSERMQSLVEQISKQYDYVLIDTPPVNVVSDCCVIASLLDGVLLLARQGRSKKEGIKQAINQLKLTDAKILGYVLNGVTVKTKGYYRYGYK